MSIIEKKEVQRGDRQVTEAGTQKLSVSNTAVKFLLDQSLGASVNTVLFIAVMGMFKGNAAEDIVLEFRQVYRLLSQQHIS